ncbi:hypothetical protein BZA77DRAFT_154567 [Pyronema omphalodes]|nr:hypothetical protein BZA77DRAFT_154567 [Pyronema omphalodes]
MLILCFLCPFLFFHLVSCKEKDWFKYFFLKTTVFRGANTGCSVSCHVLCFFYIFFMGPGGYGSSMFFFLLYFSFCVSYNTYLNLVERWLLVPFLFVSHTPIRSLR